MKILIVDDEPDVRTLVRDSLQYSQHGLEPIEAADGETALRSVTIDGPDLVILDLGLPGHDGFTVLEQLRQRSDLPVIVLTARGLEEDKIRGLKLGADDYMTKPFSPGELVARIETVLRRTNPAVSRRGVLRRGTLRIDLGARRTFRDDIETHLTPTEFNLLAELASHPGEALSHETLLTRVWGPEYRSETHYLKVYVGRLRDKLEADPSDPRLLQTVRGVGYRFAEAD
jgi:two-component system, OmpR family, KDP operon response regulator KdpE